MALTWHRIVLSPNHDLGPFYKMGDRLLLAGLLQPGTSIWFSDSGMAIASEALGKHPVRAQTLPPGITEIYLSPGTAELLQRDLAGYRVEPCERPSKDDVGLLIGDERDWTDVFR